MSWYRDLRKDIWKYMLIGILLISMSLNVYYYSIIQDDLAKIDLGSSEAAIAFSLSLRRATSFLSVNKSEELNMSIQAFIDLGQGALEALWTLTYLNPTHDTTLKPVKDAVMTLFVPDSDSSAVPAVLEHLREVSSANASAAISAITELREIASQEIQEIGLEVAKAFTSETVDISTLDRAANVANELKVTLEQWIDKYSVFQ